MINVGRVLSSANFKQSFTVYRKSGSWVAGRFTQTESTITLTGTITVASSTDLEQLPEGDREKGTIAVYSTSQLLVTTSAGTSDEILWRGDRYRAIQLSPYADYGYYKCIAVKMDPENGVSP